MSSRARTIVSGISTELDICGCLAADSSVSSTSPGSVYRAAESSDAPGSLGSVSGSGSAAMTSEAAICTDRGMPSMSWSVRKSMCFVP